MSLNIKEASGIHSISKITVSREISCAVVGDTVLALNTELIPTNPNTWYVFTADVPIRGELESLQIVLRQTPNFNTLFRVPLCPDGFVMGNELTLTDPGVGGNGNCGMKEEDFWVPIQLEPTLNAAAGNLANGLDISRRQDDVYALVMYLNNAGTFTLTRVIGECEYHRILRHESCRTLLLPAHQALGIGRSTLGNGRGMGCANRKVIVQNIL